MGSWVKIPRGPATVKASLPYTMPLGNWEGIRSDEPEPGDLPMLFVHWPTSDREM